MDEDKYSQGFNSGYFLQKNSPDLLKTLLDGSTGESDYLMGLSEGKKQHEMELKKERVREAFSKKNTKSNDRSIDI